MKNKIDVATTAHVGRNVGRNNVGNTTVHCRRPDGSVKLIAELMPVFDGQRDRIAVQFDFCGGPDPVLGGGHKTATIYDADLWASWETMSDDARIAAAVIAAAEFSEFYSRFGC